MTKLPSIISFNSLKKFSAPISAFYIKNETGVWTAASIACNTTATVMAFKNAKAIIYTIDSAKTALSKAETKDEQLSIYIDVSKMLAPLVLPILAFQIAGTVATFKIKSTSDKKIAELTQALTMANNAITAYQAFQKEAEEVIPEEKMEEIKKTVAETVVAENPQTVENTVPSTISANNVYRYYDATGKRYFYSCLSPTAIRERIHNYSILFTKHEINNFDDYGNCKVTYNDIWDLIDSNLKTESGRVYGWTDENLRYYDVAEDALDVEIEAAEDPNDANETVWWFQLNGHPLFRTRY